MIHLIYASVETQSFGEAQLTHLLENSRKANLSAGITGMLLYSGGNFFQVIEGKIGHVTSLYEKIGLDPRHKQLTLIIREPIVKRHFENWTMGFSSMSQQDLTEIDGMNDFFGDGSCFTQLGSGRAKKLLAAFAEGRWQAKLTNPNSSGV